MPQRPRHPRAELEILLRAAEDRGWRVDRGSRYFRLRCPCAQRHMRSVHLTPSDPKYRRNVLGWLKRCDCWKAEGS